MPLDSLLDNVWFVSISASLIATLIVFCVSQIVSRMKHKQQITEANNFVVNQLRAFIVNACIPPDDILAALINSAARRFKVSPDELLSMPAFIEEVVSEIIGNVYLKTDDQVRYLDQINFYLSEHAYINHRPYTPPPKSFFLMRLIQLFLVFLAYFPCVLFFQSLLWGTISNLVSEDVTSISLWLFYLASWALSLFVISVVFLLLSKIFRKKISSRQEQYIR